MVQDMGTSKTLTARSEKPVTKVRQFQKLMNRTFVPCQEDITLTSRGATFPLGTGLIRKSPHDSPLRFEWSLPYTKGPILLLMIMSHKWVQDGLLMAIDLKDLHEGELYQISASRENQKDNPELDGPECLSVIQESTHRKQPYTFIRGSTLCNKMSFLAHLDPANVQCDSGRNLVQSLSRQFFNNDGLIMFYGPEAQPVRFRAQLQSLHPKPLSLHWFP